MPVAVRHRLQVIGQRVHLTDEQVSHNITLLFIRHIVEG